MAASSLKYPPLPSGFELEESSELPPLPSGFILENEAPAEESFGKKLTRTALQLPQGALELTPFGQVTSAQQLFGTGEALAELEELEERLPELREKFPQFNIPEKIDREKYMKAVQAASSSVPTISNIASFLEEKTGLPLSPQSGIDKLVRFLSNVSKISPEKSVTEKIGKGLKGAATKESLQQLNVPEPISDILGASVGLSQKTPQAKVKKTKAEERAATQEVKMESGLSQPRSIESEATKFATINPERQKRSIDRLNKEASDLTKKSLEKHVPLAKEIEQGFDFEKQFEHEFGKLKSAAAKADPDIDIKPVFQFFKDTRDKYKGITTLDPEGTKIMREINNFRKNPQIGLDNLLKIYRHNNKKLKGTFERSRIFGKQDDYVNFLVDFNRAISKSFEETLPKDSQWMNDFLNNNKRFSNFINTKKTLGQLKPLLEGEITPSFINKLALDPKAQKRLSLSMGEEGSKEVIQIAGDLKKASESIKSIPTKEMKAFDAIFPVGMVLPFLKIPAAITGAFKVGQASRNLMGYYLSTPQTRVVYRDAINALKRNDLPAYKSASDILKKQMKKDGISSVLKISALESSKILSDDHNKNS